MNPGAPDSEPAPPVPRSLAGRVADAMRTRRPVPPSDASWRVAATLAALLAAGPVLTIVGAKLLAATAATQSAKLRVQLAPRTAAEAQTAAAQAVIAPAIAQPTLGATLEALARVLPADVTLVRAERGVSGALEFDFAAADPDRIRQALRRDPNLTRLRNVGQRQGDGAMIVSFRADTP